MLKQSDYAVSYARNSQGGTEGPENPKTDDIYRLGVILTEVITGRPINSQSELDDMKFQVMITVHHDLMPHTNHTFRL